MHDSSLLIDGFTLMVLGMGIVFAFLVLLVFTLKGMSLLVARFEPSVALPRSAAVGAVPTPHATGPTDAELIAVIGAAVVRYRSSRH